MSPSTKHTSFVFLVLGAFVIAVVFDAKLGFSQSRGGARSGSTVKTTSAVREKPATVGENSSTLRIAASRNAELRNELSWTFGGKQQRGWYLYEPLVSQLLKTTHNTSSEGFAAALVSWQKRSGLVASGVLDEASLNEMVSQWQASRLKNRSIPPPEDLITAPVSDFYDPTRAEDLRKVERNTYAAYKRMVASAIADRSLGLAEGSRGELAAGEKYLKIVSAFRSREYQEKLRRESPNAGRAGLAVNSPHFTGRALDLYVGGDPVETKDSNRALQVQTRVYQWLVHNAERFGFRPYYYEPWHWEYVK